MWVMAQVTSGRMRENDLKLHKRMFISDIRKKKSSLKEWSGV